jgi:hypothetical protein
MTDRMITTRELFTRMGNNGDTFVMMDDLVILFDRATRSGTSYVFEGYDTDGENHKIDVMTADLDAPWWIVINRPANWPW